jgi:hypothetical protein
MTEHRSDCALYAVHWLRHAVAAAGRLATDDPDAAADKKSAMALIDTLAYFAELDSWETVTLLDVANQATLMNDEEARELVKHMCTCGAFD